MNENYTKVYDDEVEIDIRDLFFYLLRHWRSLLIMIVLGAILGSGIYVVKKTAFEKSAAASAEQSNWVETYEVSTEMKSKMDLAWQNRQAYNKQLSYNENSLIMQMDAEHVYSGKLKYYIAAGSSTRLIAEQFNNILNDSGLAEELKDASGIECDAQYIRELFSCDVNAENDSSVNISSTVDGIAPSTKNVVVTYTVNYMDKDACQKMLDIIQEKADTLENKLQKEYGEFTCNQLGSSVVLMVNSSYLSQQKTNIDYLQAYANNFNSLESSFIDKDLEYYQIIYLNKEVTAIQTATFSGSKLKWLIIGVLVLCCLWGIVLIVSYVLDKHIKTIDEVKIRYQLPILGILYVKKAREGFDGFIENVYQSGNIRFETIDYIAETISLIGVKQVMLCCEDLNTEAAREIEKLETICSSITTARYVDRDTAALERAKSMDGIIFAIEKEKTMYADIERSLEVCSLQGIDVIGVIALN